MPSSVSTLAEGRTEEAVPVSPPAPDRSLLRGWGDWASVAWFLVPALVLFLVFVLAPIVVAVCTGFFKWGGIGPMDDFVGFANYTKLFDDQVFLGDLGRGLYLIVLSITVQLPFALFTAVLLNQRLRGRAVYRMLFFAPYILSEVVTAVLFTMIFLPGAGMADHLAGLLGLEELRGKWLADPSTVMPTLFVVMIWKYFGFHMMLFLAGLQSIPSEILEAASIDGAGPWQRFRHSVRSRYWRSSRAGTTSSCRCWCSTTRNGRRSRSVSSSSRASTRPTTHSSSPTSCSPWSPPSPSTRSPSAS
ncbi:carbohydrate ABC transporter permease [Streptomyces sp. NPDC057027]|uniref:carbohydrate ABC transporter permease n=1 Tax=Streptomyces sp. NPDC057027 TaxID=3346004 RepID=UPI0036272C32